MNRSRFLQTSGILAAAAATSGVNALAGAAAPSHTHNPGQRIRPSDPQWVHSLYERGNATTYLKSRNELRYIGMPVGGLFCGTLYLGGDGRLWLWDIFNNNQEGINPLELEWGGEVHAGRKIRSRDGSAYVAPATDIRPVDQGFLFEITSGGKTIRKRMLEDDWDEIVFEATYPLARITYIDRELAIEITAEVFSPFIALDEINSGLPATIYSFSVENKTDKIAKIRITGWLENKVCIRTAEKGDERVNKTLKTDGMVQVCSTIENTDPDRRISSRPDYGSMSLGVLADKGAASPDAVVDGKNFTAVNAMHAKKTIASGNKLTGTVSLADSIAPGQTRKMDFVIAWHFANLSFAEIPDEGRYYNTVFKDASAVAGYINKNYRKLYRDTKLWKDTWYDSTLPWWFLERTFLNISCLATTTSHRMESGRFYAWEGVGACPGTCTHVWQYAQAAARIFPKMEIDLRERVDLGLALQKDGSIWFRGEAEKRPAVDGQAGTILRFYREHRMSNDDRFLRRNWKKIKNTIRYLMKLDKNNDGMEDTPLENTLDAMWDGEIAWIVGLCIAAVKAGALMAVEMDDPGFASICTDYVNAGAKNMEEKLFNGEYFIHRPDAEKGRKNVGSYNTCHIDQVYGQSWAFQAGIGRILDREKVVLALKSLWKYNFVPDVGPYLKDKKGWRPYALPGEAGMVMNTNPRHEEKPYGENGTWQMGYFHECMSGFEHQVASHMMAEGMIEEALILTRAVHDRYHAAKRNPFNEIECSDHYARAMASYGTFVSACGFEYHGPKRFMKFGPKLQPENFKAPFTAAEGWGTYQQKIDASGMDASLHVKYGVLPLTSIGFEINNKVKKAVVIFNGKPLDCQFAQNGMQLTINFASLINIRENQKLVVRMS